MNKIFLLFLFGATQAICMEKNVEISYTDHALERMRDLKVAAQDVTDVIINGDKGKDKKNRNVILYKQRSALPHYEREVRDYDQLVVVVAKDLVDGKTRVLNVYYNADVFKPRQKGKKEKWNEDKLPKQH